MAAPSPTTRVTPAGIALQDGYQTLITIAADPNISFWEKTVTPPGIEGGEPVDTTTMHNAAWMTRAPRQLADLTPMTTRVAWDPDVYDEILAVINQRTTITIDFYDSSTLAFFGYLRSFAPGEIVEGSQPEADITLVPTNWDFNNNVEAGPTLTEVEGT